MKRIPHHSDKIPHWSKGHSGERRWPVSFVVFIVIALQFLLPDSLSLHIQPLICGVELLLATILLIANPGRIANHHSFRWVLAILLTGTMTLSNITSAIHLIDNLITAQIKSASVLLESGGSIWLTNVVIFSLWYWEFDRGGPGARAEGLDPYPDFLFPQMTSTEYAHQNWAPTFFDYLYTSFTNASAFSPTDVLPLTRWAKFLMLIQSLTSLVTVGLVIARAVNILR